MTEKEFFETLEEDGPPEGLSPALKALWFAEKGDWDQAHRIAQDDDTSEGRWVHAYLHREEGDTGNAHYWYRRAGKTMPDLSVEDERRAIIRELLQAGET